MKIKVTVGPDGSVQFVTQEGSFEQGKALLEALRNGMAAQGVGISQVGQVETHRHDQAHEHVHEHTHAE